MSGALRWLNPSDWKRAVALVILWAYAYQLIVWPLLFWGVNLLTTFTPFVWPAPPIVPYEQLLAGTTTLATIGGIETWRGKRGKEQAKPAEVA